MGVMQLVGEAFKEEHNMFETTLNKSVLLGISNWTTIRGRDDLKSTDVSKRILIRFRLLFHNQSIFEKDYCTN